MDFSLSFIVGGDKEDRFENEFWIALGSRKGTQTQWAQLKFCLQQCSLERSSTSWRTAPGWQVLQVACTTSGQNPFPPRGTHIGQLIL